MWFVLVESSHKRVLYNKLWSCFDEPDDLNKEVKSASMHCAGVRDNVFTFDKMMTLGLLVWSQSEKPVSRTCLDCVKTFCHQHMELKKICCPSLH